ncbi:WD40/YVTN/BNR-like repeat-containing protein [Actinopolymorpha pittospori]
MLARLARVGMAAALAGLALIPATAAAASTAAAHARLSAAGRLPTVVVEGRVGQSVDAALVATPAGFSPTSTSWPTAVHGWVLGFAPCASGECAVLMRTLDGGDTWTEVPAPPVRTSPSHDQVRVLFAERKDSSGGTLAVGATGGDESFVHMSFDGGHTWETTLAVSERGPVFDLAFSDSQHGTLVCGNPDLHNSELYRTSDGGHTWEPFTTG